jgi:ATP-binding cassette, subfamily B, bacterial
MKITAKQTTKFVWKYFCQKPLWLGILFVILVLGTISEIAMPHFVGILVDFIVENFDAPAENFNAALKIVGFIVITGVSFWTFDILKHWIYDYEKLFFMQKMTQDIFAKVQRFSTEWHINSFAGATVRKISRGIWAFNQLADEFIFGFIPLILLTIGMVIVMFLRWPQMGIFLAIAGILYTIISLFLVIKLTNKSWQRAARSDTKVGAALADAISCNSAVKIFGREKSEDKIFTRVAAKWRTAHWIAWFRSNGTALLQSIVMTFLKLGMFLLVLNFWKNGQASVGDVAFVIGMYNLFSSHLRSIGDRILNAQHAARDMEDIVKFSLMPIHVADKKNAKDLVVKNGTIEFKKINFCYANQKQAIFENFSLKIKAGENIALVGYSGSGKSTFVKLLQRLYDLDTGAITIDDQNITQVTQKSLRRALGLVPQDPVLFHRSLIDNISYGKPKASLAEIQRAARAAHASEFIKKLPQKYDTLVGERGIKLSGGERQRVAIARTMLADPLILILDEATSSLDSESEKLIQDALEKLMKNRTTIVVAHRLSTIKKADRILVFENGKVAEQGSHTCLVRRKNGIYRKLFELQAGGFI